MTLLITAASLIFAVALAASGTLGRAYAAPAGSLVRRRKALVTEFGLRLIVAIPLTLLISLMAWLILSPSFNPPQGAIR